MNARQSTLLLGSALALVFALAAGVRLWDIGADPPAALDGDFISDEGWWAHNARSHFLFGRWVTDDFNQAAYTTPVHTLLLRVAFGALGLGLEQARLVSTLAGLTTLVALVAWLRWSLGWRAALFGAAAFAADYFSYTYHRVAMVEANAIAMMTVAVALCAVPRRHPAVLVAAGALGVLAVFTKTNSVFFLPALLAAAVVKDRSGAQPERTWRKSAAWLALGGSICALSWMVFFVIPNWSEFLRQNQSMAAEGRVTGSLLITQGFSFGLLGGVRGGPVRLGGFLTQSLIPIVLGSTWLWFHTIRMRRDGVRKAFAKTTGAERVALVWIAFQFLYVATNYSTHDRRYLAFVIPLTVLGASLSTTAWNDLKTGAGKLADSFASSWGSALALAVVAALYLRAPIATRLTSLTANVSVGTEPGFSPATLAALATVIIVLLTVPLFRFLLRRGALRAWPVSRIGVVVALLGLGLVTRFYARDWLDRTHTIRDVGRELEQRWGAEARVCGGIGETLLMSSSIPILVVLDRRFSGFGIYGAGVVEGFSPTRVIETPARDEAELKRTVEPLLPGFEVVPDSVEVFSLCRRADGSPRFLAAAGTLRRISTGTRPGGIK